MSYPLVCRYVNCWEYLYPFYCSWSKNSKSDHLEKYCHLNNKANSQIMTACVNNDTVGFVEGGKIWNNDKVNPFHYTFSVMEETWRTSLSSHSTCSVVPVVPEINGIKFRFFCDDISSFMIVWLRIMNYETWSLPSRVEHKCNSFIGRRRGTWRWGDEQRCQALSPACGLHLCGVWERLGQKPFGISQSICLGQIIISSRLQWT